MPETEKGDWLVPKMRHTKNKINFSSLSLDHLPPPLLRFATEFNTARMPTRPSLSRCRSGWVSCTVAKSVMTCWSVARTVASCVVMVVAVAAAGVMLLPSFVLVCG
jgi:hypothetical protein